MHYLQAPADREGERSPVSASLASEIRHVPRDAISCAGLPSTRQRSARDVLPLHHGKSRPGLVRFLVHSQRDDRGSRAR